MIKETKGALTRRKIVAEAAPIFNKHGFEGSSMNALMAATGLKKGGIYRHFSSKEELAAEAFDYMWEQTWSSRMGHLDPKLPGVDQLKQSIDAFIRYRLPFGGGCPVLNTAIDSDDGNALLRERVRRALDQWLTRMQSIVKKAARRGEIRHGVEPKTVAAMILATLEGALMISRVERSDDALRRAQKHLHFYLDTQVAA